MLSYTYTVTKRPGEEECEGVVESLLRLGLMVEEIGNWTFWYGHSDYDADLLRIHGDLALKYYRILEEEWNRIDNALLHLFNPLGLHLLDQVLVKSGKIYRCRSPASFAGAKV